MALALDEPREGEKPLQINGVDVLMSDHDMQLTDGVTLDYIVRPRGEGFAISGFTRECD